MRPDPTTAHGAPRRTFSTREHMRAHTQAQDSALYGKCAVCAVVCRGEQCLGAGMTGSSVRGRRARTLVVAGARTVGHPPFAPRANSEQKVAPPQPASKPYRVGGSELQAPQGSGYRTGPHAQNFPSVGGSSGVRTSPKHLVNLPFLPFDFPLKSLRLRSNQFGQPCWQLLTFQPLGERACNNRPVRSAWRSLTKRSAKEGRVCTAPKLAGTPAGSRSRRPGAGATFRPLECCTIGSAPSVHHRSRRRTSGRCVAGRSAGTSAASGLATSAGTELPRLGAPGRASSVGPASSCPIQTQRPAVAKADRGSSARSRAEAPLNGANDAAISESRTTHGRARKRPGSRRRLLARSGCRAGTRRHSCGSAHRWVLATTTFQGSSRPSNPGGSRSGSARSARGRNCLLASKTVLLRPRSAAQGRSASRQTNARWFSWWPAEKSPVVPAWKQDHSAVRSGRHAPRKAVDIRATDLNRSNRT